MSDKEESRVVLEDLNGKQYVRDESILCSSKHQARIVNNLKVGNPCWYFQIDDSELGYILHTKTVSRIVSVDVPSIKDFGFQRNVLIYFQETDECIEASDAFWSRKAALNFYTFVPGFESLLLNHFDLLGIIIPVKSFRFKNDAICLN